MSCLKVHPKLELKLIKIVKSCKTDDQHNTCYEWLRKLKLKYDDDKIHDLMMISMGQQYEGEL